MRTYDVYSIPSVCIFHKLQILVLDLVLCSGNPDAGRTMLEISGGERTKSTVIFTLRTPYLRYGLKKNMSDVVVVNIFVTIKITCQHDVTHNLQPYSELVRSSTKLGPIAKRICCNQSIGQITCNKILHGLHSKLVFTFVGLMYVSFGT